MARRLAAALVACGLAVTASCRSDGDGSSSAARSPTSTAAAPATTTTVEPAPTVPPPATAPTCPATPRRARPDPNRPRYRLSIDLRLAENTVIGTTDVRFTPDLDTDHLVFRLWGNSPRSNQAGGSMQPGAVTVDGREATTTLDDPTILVVRPRAPLRAGTAVDVHVPWKLILPGSARDRLAREGDAVRLGSFFPILPWEPGVGWQTDPATADFAEASTAPVADFDVTVVVPGELNVLASGVADRPGHWTATAMRDVALSIGRFTTATATAMAPDPVQVTVGVHQGVPEVAEPYLNKVVDALEDFGRRYGPYPWPAFTLAITPGVGGGIEYPGHIMQGPGTLGSITSHEVAHQWFYALVGNDQGSDPWLDEGLASWGEARYERSLDRFVSTTIPPSAAGRLGEPMTFWSQQPSVYGLGVYVQGVQALAALGDPDLVDCALRTYVAVFAHRIARPPDLVAALRASFPDAAAILSRFGARG
jgi:hypothetical protein